MTSRDLESGNVRRMMPTVNPDRDEVERLRLHDQTLETATSLFRRYGCLLIENAFDAALVREVHASYMTRYRRYFDDKKHADALSVGNRRLMITVRVHDRFNDPYLYANP